MAEWSVIQPSSEQQWNAYYKLRFDVLRKPWNQEPGSERVDDDQQSVHGMILDQQGGALAVGRIHKTDDGRAQIRFMAVHPDYQGKGLGKAMLRFIEHVGQKSLGPISEIILHARENAKSFYHANGYLEKEKSYLLFDEIQHYLMVKTVGSKE